MFVMIWMWTQEWSLISRRSDRVHVRDVPPRLDLWSASTLSSSRRSFRLPRAGTRRCIARDRLGRGEPRVARRPRRARPQPPRPTSIATSSSLSGPP